MNINKHLYNAGDVNSMWLTPDWLTLNETCLLFVGLWVNEGWEMKDDNEMKDENRRLTLTIALVS
jgi:hypothetical protein